MTIQLITNDNGVGLSQDLRLMTDILRAEGHEVFYTHHLHPAKEADVNIFLEILVAPAMRKARKKNILIPNPEWFMQPWRKHARQCNAIWCKTRHAEKIFSRLGNAVYCGWTSRDLFSNEQRHWTTALHMAGSSYAKNSPEAVAGFAASRATHLNIVSRKAGNQLRRQTGNLPTSPRFLLHRDLTDAALRELAGRCGIHLCPSSCEGWGHYIVEAMSTGAIVITTNAAPMNEIVQPDRGVLVACKASGAHGYSQQWGVAPDAITAAINKVIGMDDQQRRTMGANAREWFLRNDREFRNRIVQLSREL